MKIRFVKQLVALASLQIAFGILAIYFNDVNRWLIGYRVYQIVTSGKVLWIGFAFIVTGLFGLFGGIRKNISSVIAFNILSIITASLTVPLLIISAMAAHKEFGSYYRLLSRGPSYPPADEELAQSQKTVAIMDTLVAVVAALEAIVAICSSVICCINGACCPSDSDSNSNEMRSIS